VSTEEPIIVKRGKFSPEVEAQDLMAGDWENLAELETHAVEVIGEAFDEGFRKGVTDERQRVSESAAPAPAASTPPAKAAKPAPRRI